MRLRGRGAVVLAALATVASLATAQPPAARAGSQPPIVAGAPALRPDAPLQCWWRASSGAIRVGEIVDVALTCAVLESATVTVVPDESRLTVAAVQLSPFEIVDGSHPPDVVDGERRYFQYRYRLRIISPDVVGRDVKLPPLAISYRLQSRVSGGATLNGRDLVHQMPQLIVRVVSQVPADADDIRDSSEASLAEIDALRFRAGAFSVAAMVLTALGAVVALSALVPATGWLRRQRATPSRRSSDRQVLGHAVGVLDRRLADAGGAGWTAEGLAEAHGAARLVAAVGIGAGVRERLLEGGAAVPDGRLAIRRRFGRPAVALTTHVTAGHLVRALAALPPDASATARVRLERLGEALATLTRTQYGAGETADTASVVEAVAAARDIGAEMARETLLSPRAWLRRQPSPPPVAEF